MAIQIPVFIEPIKEGAGFRATGSDPFSVTAEGATEDEAVQNYRTAMATRLNHGTKVVAVDLAGNGAVHEANPLLALAGDMADDPLFDRWQEAINVGSMDLRIAAIALEEGTVVVTPEHARLWAGPESDNRRLDTMTT